LNGDLQPKSKMVEVRSPIAAAFEAPGPPEELGALGDGYFEASHIVISRAAVWAP
jgi:hypothetical protein